MVTDLNNSGDINPILKTCHHFCHHNIGTYGHYLKQLETESIFYLVVINDDCNDLERCETLFYILDLLAHLFNQHFHINSDLC